MGASGRAVTVDLPAMSRPGLLTAGAGTARLPVTRACRLVGVRAMVSVAPTGGPVQVDLNRNGTTVFTTQGNRPTIAAAGTDSGSAVPDVTALAAGDYLTLDVDAVGLTVAGEDLVVVPTVVYGAA